MILIVGERINSTRQKIREAISRRDAAYILAQAERQISSGAQYIDVNCAMTAADEVQDIDWVVSVLQSSIKDVNICIDSPNYLAIERALGTYKAKGGLMINSITAEEARIKNILPLALKYRTKLVALTMNEKGMPDTAEERFEIAKFIYERVQGTGSRGQEIYFDALIRPISTEPNQAKEFLRAIPMIKSLGAKTICGLSNVSFGLPERSAINSTFLSMAIHAGLDAAILDPTDSAIYASIKASGALLGTDEYCAEYIAAFREGKLR